jgi:hypothetical protein
MKIFWHFPVLLMLLVATSSCTAHKSPVLPEFVPNSTVSTAMLKQDCAQVYPQGKWQFVHAIDFTMAAGRGSSVLGVTVLDGNTVHCALVTIEGLTLFEARLVNKTGKPKVLRELPPFDKPGFAAGLLADVRAMFIRPAAWDGTIQYGSFGDNMPGCRLQGDDGRTTDILPSADGCWQVNALAGELDRDRIIIARSCILQDGYRVPKELELTVPGPVGYILKMTLLSAEKLQGGKK